MPTADDTSVLPDQIESVADGRRLIDEIDGELHSLITRRAGVSRQIQAIRQATGGPRVQHQRENEIIAGYRSVLGRPGVAIALAILAYCRGERPGG